MANRIKIKKGLQIPLMGKPETVYRGELMSELMQVCPEDFQGIIPKLKVKVDDTVKAGQALFFSKMYPEMLFVSPVSGKVTAIERGAKRRILNITIQADKQQERIEFGKKDVARLSADEIRKSLLESGVWYVIKQRPYDIVANPDKAPRDIFITGFDSSPLAPSYDFILEGQETDFQTGLDALAKLTQGKLYLSVGPETKNKALRNAKNAVITEFAGPHPAGNVGVHINHLAPVNKGETVWTLTAPDVLFIGRLFNKGYADFTRTIALTGSEVKQTGYYKMLTGTLLKGLFKNNVTEGINLRYISGNPLTGTQIGADGVLRATHSQVTVIPEGDDVHEFIGWASMSPERYSAGGTYLKMKKEYRLDARVLGGPRGIIVSNEYDKVFPMDIFPEQLIKAIIAFNIDKMENLGIYEVSPEDFALCEFVDTSKLELQHIVRTGLDMLRKEVE